MKRAERVVQIGSATSPEYGLWFLGLKHRDAQTQTLHCMVRVPGGAWANPGKAKK